MNIDYVKTLEIRKDINSLIDLKNSVVYRTNDTGFEMFNLIKHNHSIEAIGDILAKKYSVDSKEVVNDAINFIESLNLKMAKTHNINLLDQDMLFPLYLEIEITSKCNWNCSFCYNTWKKGQYKVKDLDINVIKNILRECKNNNCMIVRYSGGEPTLHNNFREIIEFGNKLGLKQALFTNATKLDAESIKFLSENNVSQILLSIHGEEKIHDGLTNVKGSFKNTLEAIKLLVNSKLDLVVEITVTKSNINNIPNIFKELVTYRVKHINLMKYVNTKRNDDENSLSEKEFRNLVLSFKSYKDLKVSVSCSPTLCGDDEKKILLESKQEIENTRNIYIGSCQAGIRWASISVDGGIRCCPHSNYIFDYYDSTIGISPIFLKMRENIIKTTNKSKCNNCHYFKECLGGCYLDKI